MNSMNYFSTPGQGQEILAGTDPAFLADLQAKQQRLALNNAMIAQMGRNIQETPIASTSTRIGQGLLQGLFGALARREMRDIANLQRQDAEARNQAEAWKKDYLTTELDRASNPIFVNGTADEMNRARAGYDLVQNHQMQGLENNPYAVQFRNNSLAGLVQQAMNERKVLQENALDRGNMDYKQKLAKDLNDYETNNTLKIVDAKNQQAMALQAMEAQAKAQAAANMPLKTEQQKLLNEEFTPFRERGNSLNLLSNEANALFGEKGLFNPKNPATQSQRNDAFFGTKLGVYGDSLGFGDGTYTANRARLLSFLSQITLENVAKLKGALSDKDIVFVNQITGLLEQDPNMQQLTAAGERVAEKIKQWQSDLMDEASSRYDYYKERPQEQEYVKSILGGSKFFTPLINPTIDASNYGG